MYRLIPVVFLLLTACGSQPSPAPTVPRTASPTASAAADVCHQGSTIFCVQNPAVTQDTIGSTICQRGWTKTVRPDIKFTNDLKRQQLALYADRHPNDPNWTVAGTEEDHRLPLELGGAPRDPMNLSPEEGPSPNPKDRDESGFKQLVCAHKLALVAAQVQFIAKWLAPYPEYKQ